MARTNMLKKLKTVRCDSKSLVLGVFRRFPGFDFEISLSLSFNLLSHVEVANDEDIEKLMSKDGQQVKFGDKQERKLWVNHDPAHNFLKKFCDKQNFDFKLSGHRQRPEIIPRGGNSSSNHGSDNRGPPPPFENSPFGSQQMPTDDGKGNPLIQQIPDLLASAVFVANLSYKTNEDDIYRHFESIGKVHNVKLQKYRALCKVIKI